MGVAVLGLPCTLCLVISKLIYWLKSTTTYFSCRLFMKRREPVGFLPCLKKKTQKVVKRENRNEKSYAYDKVVHDNTRVQSRERSVIFPVSLRGCW